MSEEEMKKYCDKIKNDDSIDLDWLIAVKRTKIDEDKNFYNLVLVFYLSLMVTFITGVIDSVIVNYIFLMGMAVLLLFILSIIAVRGGKYGYKNLLSRNIAELEVLEYLKKQSATKRTIHFRVENGKLATLKAKKDVKNGKVHGGFSSVDDLIKELDS